MQYLQGVGPEYLDDPQWDRLEKAIGTAWVPKTDTVFLTICSWAKPYSHSYIHDAIRRHFHRYGLLRRIDYVHISSCGIVPSDCELWATNYDWNNAWVQDTATLTLLRERIAQRLNRFLQQHTFRQALVYLRPGSNTHIAVFDQTVSPVPLVDVFPRIAEAKIRQELEDVRGWRKHEDPDDVLTLMDVLEGMTKVVSQLV